MRIIGSTVFGRRAIETREPTCLGIEWLTRALESGIQSRGAVIQRDHARDAVATS